MTTWRQVIREGWINTYSYRMAKTLRDAGLPVAAKDIDGHTYELTRQWVVDVYQARPGTNPLIKLVGDAVRVGLTPEACESAHALGGVDAVIDLAHGYLP